MAVLQKWLNAMSHFFISLTHPLCEWFDSQAIFQCQFHDMWNIRQAIRFNSPPLEVVVAEGL